MDNYQLVTRRGLYRTSFSCSFVTKIVIEYSFKMFVVDHKCREKNVFLVRFWSSICVLGKIVLFYRYDGFVTKIEYLWRSFRDEYQFQNPARILSLLTVGYVRPVVYKWRWSFNVIEYVITLLFQLKI